MPMYDFNSGDIWLRQINPIVSKAAQFYPEPLIISNNKAQIFDLGNINTRIIDFSNDAFGGNKPKP